MPLARITPRLASFAPPPIVVDWSAGSRYTHDVSGATVLLRVGGSAALASVVIEKARHLEPTEFADCVTAAYQAIDTAIAATPHAHIIRWWNGVPGIHDRVDTTRDRYMAFNAGRFAALRRRYGDAGLADEAPAASGVGIAGDALILHALATAAPGHSMQNDRQRLAVRYSSRFGPLPPCFARATLAMIDSRPSLFLAGTAAILGQDTVCLNDLDGQLATTIDHLKHLLANADMMTPDLRSLRAYLPMPSIELRVRQLLEATFGTDLEYEFIPAELCRRDLLVEVEGVAIRGAR